MMRRRSLSSRSSDQLGTLANPLRREPEKLSVETLNANVSRPGWRAGLRLPELRARAQGLRLLHVLPSSATGRVRGVCW